MPTEDKAKELSFEKSAKKFKPGPTAAPVSEEDRPDIGGTGLVKQDDPAGGSMSDGAPGQFKKMPEE
jgi:hypothetical protein